MNKPITATPPITVPNSERHKEILSEFTILPGRFIEQTEKITQLNTRLSEKIKRAEKIEIVIRRELSNLQDENSQLRKVIYVFIEKDAILKFQDQEIVKKLDEIFRSESTPSAERKSEPPLTFKNYWAIARTLILVAVVAFFAINVIGKMFIRRAFQVLPKMISY